MYVAELLHGRSGNSAICVMMNLMVGIRLHDAGMNANQ